MLSLAGGVPGGRVLGWRQGSEISGSEDWVLGVWCRVSTVGELREEVLLYSITSPCSLLLSRVKVSSLWEWVASFGELWPYG